MSPCFQSSSCLQRIRSPTTDITTGIIRQTFLDVNQSEKHLSEKHRKRNKPAARCPAADFIWMRCRCAELDATRKLPISALNARCEIRRHHAANDRVELSPVISHEFLAITDGMD
jgi:hypothetical protein